MKKIQLLGLSKDSICLMFDLLHETYNFDFFDIYLNIPLKIIPETRFKTYDYNVNTLEAKLNTSVPIFWGTAGAKNRASIYEDFNKSQKVFEKYYMSIVSSSAYVASSSFIANGVMIEPNCVVSSQTEINFGSMVKRGCSIGHHNTIGRFCDINPGTITSGNVTIGNGCTLGTGTVVSDNIEIGENTIIGVGSVVTKDIPANVIAFGNPCKVIRENY